MLLLLSIALAAGPDPFAVDAVVEDLPCGARVIVESRTRTDEVALRLHLGVGSRDEAEGERGLAHLVEHLMFEGSANVPGNAYDEWLTAAGGENNATTSEDGTVFYAAFPSGALDLALFLETDRLATLGEALSQESLDNQISVVLREREQGYSAPHGRDFDALSRLIYPASHPYHVPVIGTRADIEGAELPQVLAFVERWVRPAHATLAIVGRVDVQEALDRARWWFSDVPVSEPITRQPASPPPRHQDLQRGLLSSHVEDSTLHLAWPSVPVTHDDALSLWVAATVLSDGRGTRIDDLAQRGWIRSARAQAWSGEIDGLFVVSGTTASPARLARLERRLLGEVRGLVDRPPSEAELQRARRRLRRRLLLSLERPDRRAQALLDCVRSFDDPDCTRLQAERLEALRPSDIAEAVERLLSSPGGRLWVVPHGSEDTAPEAARPVELP